MTDLLTRCEKLSKCNTNNLYLQIICNIVNNVETYMLLCVIIVFYMTGTKPFISIAFM